MAGFTLGRFKVDAVNSLLGIVRELRERIKKYGKDLTRSEALTRYVLVDPLLRALGWDTEDPNRVRPEEMLGDGKPDYVLLAEGRPVIALEVKKLNTLLSEEKTLKLGFEYAWSNKIPYFIITDGCTLIAYDVKEPGGRQLFTLSISAEEPEEVVRKLLSLWYPLVARGRVESIGTLEPERVEVVQPKLPTPAEAVKPPFEELDVEKVRKFYKSLTPSEQALLKIAFKAWKSKRVLKSDEIIEEMGKRGINIRKGSLAGIKTGIIKRAKKEGIPPPLATGVKLKEEWGRALEKVLVDESK